MRLDKYLKLSRIIKRRVVAKELAEVGAVRLNEKKARPDAEVKKGDRLEIAFPRKIMAVEVLEADESLLKKRAIPFLLLEERQVTAEGKPW